jgi:hypothetical protein
VEVREEHGLRVFENGVLRKIFGPRMEKVEWKWRRLHSEEGMICTAHQILFE